MPKTLVIVESPSKAKTISKYLGSDYIVKSSVGHIRDLPKGKSKTPTQRNTIPKDLPEDEKRLLKKINERKRLVRRMGIDPDNGWAANYEIIPEKEKVIKELKTAAKSVVLCVDTTKQWYQRRVLRKQLILFAYPLI